MANGSFKPTPFLIYSSIQLATLGYSIELRRSEASYIPTRPRKFSTYLDFFRKKVYRE